MSHSKEISRCLIRTSIKDIGQCIGSNRIIGNIGKIAMEQTLCRYYSPLQHVVKMGLNFPYC